MSTDDDDYYGDDDDDGALVDNDGGGVPADLPAAEPPKPSIRDWMSGKRGWILLAALAVIQAIFATVMIAMRSDAKPVVQINYRHIRDLAVDMLGHEVAVRQIYQLVPIRGGKRMTVGVDVVLVLGQLPEEQVEGADRPNEAEMALFIETINSMEPNIRSRVNMLLQQMPTEAYGTVEAGKIIKEDVMKYVNDILDGLDFGKGLRPGLGKRRVTDVLLPLFVRQMM